jgi:hypothetical protein
VSVFDSYKARAYPHTFTAEIHVHRIAGGTPTDPNVAEGWLRTKLGDKDDLIRQAVAETMVELGVDAEEATEKVNGNRHLNAFKRDPQHGLYIEGRQMKACIKEAANIRWPSPLVWYPGGDLRKGGQANAKENKGRGRGKMSPSFFAEHVFVQEHELWLGVTEPSGVAQRFVHTFNGSGIQYEEYVDDAKVDFTVMTDHDFSAEQWAMLWLTGEQQGIGASRSQGYGRYEVTRWDKA